MRKKTTRQIACREICKELSKGLNWLFNCNSKSKVTPIIDEEPELYNLADDPGESEDVAKDNPEIVSKLLNDLESWFESVENDRKKIDDPLHTE